MAQPTEKVSNRDFEKNSKKWELLNALRYQLHFLCALKLHPFAYQREIFYNLNDANQPNQPTCQNFIKWDNFCKICLILLKLSKINVYDISMIFWEFGQNQKTFYFIGFFHEFSKKSKGLGHRLPSRVIWAGNPQFWVFLSATIQSEDHIPGHIGCVWWDLFSVECVQHFHMVPTAKK